MIDTRPDYSKIRINATKAIREKCLDCCCWQEAEVKICHIVKCPLWRFRMGKEQRDSPYVMSTRYTKKRIPDASAAQGRASEEAGWVGEEGDQSQ